MLQAGINFNVIYILRRISIAFQWYVEDIGHSPGHRVSATNCHFIVFFQKQWQIVIFSLVKDQNFQENIWKVRLTWLFYFSHTNSYQWYEFLDSILFSTFCGVLHLFELTRFAGFGASFVANPSGARTRTNSAGKMEISKSWIGHM